MSDADATSPLNAKEHTMGMRLALRYDMRAPSIGAPAADLYPAAVEQCAIADAAGFDTVYLAEHHGAEDGYCPAPIVLASAIMGRTTRMTVHLSALIAVLHNPLRIAEDLAVLDLISGGRVEITVGIGYRPHEYAMFGVTKAKRVKVLEAAIGVLEQAWSGEPFEYDGMTVQILPTPVQKPRPPIYIGGSTEAAARRAARYGDNFMPATAALFDVYAEELHRLGKPVPARPRPKGPLFLFVTRDPERSWELVGPHVMYTTNSNAEWAKERGVGATPYPPIRDVAELRANPQFAVVTPEDCVELLAALGPTAEITVHPLMGGLSPDVGTASLELFVAEVLPELARRGIWIDPFTSGSPT
jgi:alkanesulfonate monooxygenase SsuD/methylene tetrahydromethanopterin reductase-like flavin-dependent oxidoreductase (luciferase family)